MKDNFIRLVSATLLASGTMLFAETETQNNQSEKKFFSVSGSLGTFSKVGFNNAKIDKNKRIYPTESFTTIFGELNTTYNFLAFMDTKSISKFEIGLGGAAGALAYDSTLRDVQRFGGLESGSGMNNNYVGGWNGYWGEKNGDGYEYKRNRNLMIQNAYLALESDYVNFKGGRYESSMDYYSGYTQGINIDAHFGYGDKEDNEVKLWWFSSFGRAFAYSQWFLDFYSVKDNYDGKKKLRGIHAGGVDVNYGGYNQVGDYKQGDNLLVRTFVYFHPTLYTAPGVKFVYDNQFGNGYGITATLQGFVLVITDKNQVTKNYKGTDSTKTPARYDSPVDEVSGNINAIIKANLLNYNVRAGYYHNFGSANSHFGTYGNPMGFDFWTASVYDIGASISDVINRNAKTGYISGGGEYNLEYGVFAWDILGRITRSPRSDEESVALSLKHTFTNNMAIGFKAEWFRDTTKTGYNPGASLNAGGTDELLAKRTDDRSHAFVTFDYRF